MATKDSSDLAENITPLVVATLVATCLLIYTQVVRFDFINLDDNLYVYANPVVASGLSGSSVWWALTAFHSANWHPLTWLSHILDVTFFGPNAGGHHAMNVFFHTANSLLAFYVFRRLTGDVWPSVVVAFLFAVHPAHVESVAWISERKDVLSTLFWLLTMIAYIRFVKETNETSSLLGRMLSTPFLITFGCFALGLMSKPMLVTLPFVLLLCDYWPMQRLASLKDLRTLTIEKLPLFVLSGISCFLTIQAQNLSGAIQTSGMLAFPTRLSNGVISYVKYIAMAFYPANLGIGYEYRMDMPAWQIWGSVILLSAITIGCIWQRRERKYLIVGWLWFLGTMVPVIGLVQVGSQSMADRYTYVPYFGLFIMIAWGAAEIVSTLKLKFPITAVAAAIPIALLSYAAFNQTSHWRNSITLYSHTLAVGQGNFLTMHNFCTALAVQNRLEEAAVQCQNSIAAEPKMADPHIMLGVINVRLQKNEEAITNFRQALDLAPESWMALSNIAVPLALTGRAEEALTNIDAAVDVYRRQGVDPRGLATAYLGLGTTLAKQNKFDAAAMAYRRVLDLDQERADARANYAFILYLQEKIPEARAEIDRSIAANPDQPESYNIRGMIQQRQGETAEAAAQFERALQLKPDFKEAKDNLDRIKAGSDGTK